MNTAEEIRDLLQYLRIEPKDYRVEALLRWADEDRNEKRSPDDDIRSLSDTLEEVLGVISEVSGFSPNRIVSRSRKREVVECRNILFFCLKKLTKASLKSIGEEVGGRDHSTVIHNLETFADLWETSPKFRSFANHVISKFNLSI